MKRSPVLSALVTAFGIAAAPGASLYIGDVPSAGLAVPDGPVGPDGANGGVLTYAFFNDGYTNSSGGTELLQITEVNFNAVNPGNLTPFVAALTGGGAGAGDYNVLAVGDALPGVAGLNNLNFTSGGGNPIVSLNNGETLVAGFFQDAAMIGWADAPDADYISQGGVGGNTIPAGGSGPLTADANWSVLNREYRFNVGLDVVPEPSVPLLIGLPVALAFLVRRRRTS